MLGRLAVLGVLLCCSTVGVLGADRFLTKPFRDPEVRLQQGWVYTFDPGNCAHQGIDYVKGPSNSADWQSFEVIAAAAGIAVLHVSESLGDFVTIETIVNGNRYYTLYAHLDNTARELPVGIEVPVSRADTIGRAGSTGIDSNGLLHLHFELSINEFGRTQCAGVNGCGTCRLDPYGLFTTRAFYPGTGEQAHYWQRFPPRFGLQDRSLLKADNEATLYWFQNGKRYAIVSGSLVERMRGLPRWDINDFTLVSSAELREIVEGPVFVESSSRSNGLLIKSPDDNTVFIMQDAKLKGFGGSTPFFGMGFDFADVIDVSQDIICGFDHGPPILSNPGSQRGRIRGHVVYDRGDSREDVRRPDLLCSGFSIPRVLIQLLNPTVGFPRLLGLDFCGVDSKPAFCRSSIQEVRSKNISADRPMFDTGPIPVGAYELNLQLLTGYRVVDSPDPVVVRDGETTEVEFIIIDAQGDDPRPDELHLAISSPEFCLGDLRGVTVGNGAPNSAVFLSAWKNGELVLADQEFARTDQSGNWSEARVLQGDGLIGSWWTQVRVGTVHSNLVSFRIFDCSEDPTPVLALDRAEYCVGDEAKITIHARPNSSIDLYGVSNGGSWNILGWNRTDENGSYQGTKEMSVSDLGNYSLRVEVAGRTSDPTSFTVLRCAIPKPTIVEITPDPVRPDREVFLAVKGENFQPNFRAEVLVGPNTFPITAAGLQFVSTGHVNVSVRMAGQPNPYSAVLRITNSDGQMALRSFTVDAFEGGEDFSLTVIPPNRTIRQGDDTTVRVKVESINSFDDPVSLSLSGLPVGTAPGTGLSERILTPAPNASAETTLAILTNSSTRSGFTPVIVLGNTASTTKSAVLELTILDEIPPAISSIQPDPVQPDIQTLLTVDGSGFKTGFSAEVVEGSERFPISTNGLIFLTSRRVHVSVRMTGRQESYVATLLITNPDRQSASSLFTVGQRSDTSPSISTISPDSVTPDIPVWLTVDGENFQAGFSASVTTPAGGPFPVPDPATNLIFISPNQLRVQVEMIAGASEYLATLTITNPDGRSTSGTFTVRAPSTEAPQISNLSTSPNPPPVAQQFTFTINGSNFDPGLIEVVFTGPGCTSPPCVVPNNALTTKTSTQVIGTARLNTAGTYDVTVRHGILGTPSNSQSLTVATGTLTISSLSPSAVNSQVETQLTAIGSGFQQNFSAAVIVGSETNNLSASVLTYVNSSQVRVRVKMGDPPAGQSSYMATLRITNPDNQSASRSFTVNREGPTISSISPSSVTSPANTTLTLNGSNFQAGFGAVVNFPSGPVTLDSGAKTFINSSQVQLAVFLGDPPAGQSSYTFTVTISTSGGSATSGSVTVNRP